MELFSQRLKWLRERLNITQKEMAERIDVSQQYYNKFEKGTGQPNLETLYKIRKETNESIDFLIGYYFEDERAKDLYEFYSEAREMRTEKEEDIDYLLTSFDEKKDNFELNMKLLSHYKSDLSDLKQKEERAFKQFFEYASSIPGFTGEVSTKEYWINLYDSYQANGEKTLQKFWEEFRTI